MLCLFLTGQICLFYLDTADCRYPIDGVAMTHIVGKISECNSPADVTFNLNVSGPLSSVIYINIVQVKVETIQVVQCSTRREPNNCTY